MALRYEKCSKGGPRRKNDVIFVLDCFEKDSRITEKHDIRRAKVRFKQVRQRLMEERKNAKHKEAK